MTKRPPNPIRTARELADLSQYDLARKADLHPTTISAVERGLRVSTETMQKIATALGLRIEELRR